MSGPVPMVIPGAVRSTVLGSQTAGGFVTVIKEPLNIELFELIDVFEQPFKPGVAMQ
mgnify:CR=1